LPGIASKFVVSGSSSANSLAFATTAWATGCSEFLSTAAAARTRSSAVTPSTGTTSVQDISPLVSVPVLSSTIALSLCAVSSVSPPLMKMPISAPRPVPTMMAVGVASPIAHGQAMMSTATSLRSAPVNTGAGPSRSHNTNVTSASPMTAGTNTLATLSASRWIGAFEPCASSTILMMWASTVSLPVRVARNSKLPVRTMVAPTTSSPGPLSTGRLSPVIIDSSMAEAPVSISPSTGIFSPGLTRTVSPGATSSTGTSTSEPSRTTVAVRGARSARRLIAWEARPLARSSRKRPRSMSVIIMALVSKYTWMSLGDSDRSAGANVATAL
jgi:hypothetical protein